MPRFLTKKRIIYAIGVLFVSFALAWLEWWLAILFIIVTLVPIVLNHLVRWKQPSIHVFSANREIKKYHTLIIGEKCHRKYLSPYGEINDVLEITSPERSLEASYQIFLHVSSILERGGICIIVDGFKKVKNPYTLFDVSFLSLIVKKELKLEKLTSRIPYPLFFEPYKSFKILLGITSGKYTETECPNVDINYYCNKKGFKLIYLKQVK